MHFHSFQRSERNLYRQLLLTAFATALYPLMSTSYAATVFYGGRWLTTSVSPPAFPLDAEDCNRFYMEAQNVYQELNGAHEQCLKDNAASVSPSYEPTRSCSKPACQRLHSSRDEVQETMNEGRSQCMSAVAERQRSDSRGSFEEFDVTQFTSVLMRGPVLAVRSLAKKAVDDMIERTFGSSSDAVKFGLNVSVASAMLMNGFTKLQRACREKDIEALNNCNREMLSAVQGLAMKVPSRLRGDPGISLIQRAMLERLTFHVKELEQEMDAVSEQMDNVGSSDSQPRHRSTTGSRSASSPLIENR